MKISAIVITKNESANIGRCLQSLVWADEVIMVDSGSTDDTIQIASEFKNVKIIVSDWLGYSDTKKLAIRYTRNNWILWLDADEALTDELIVELHTLQIDDSLQAAFDMPRKTFFMNEWVRYAGWYPGRVVRLFDKHRCQISDSVLHEGVVVPDSYQISNLHHDILHYSYTSLQQYFHKMNIYGKYGAEELIRKGKKFSTYQLIFNPLFSFVKFFFLKKGFKNGRLGLIISIGSAFSNFIKYTNFYYLQKKGRV